jgi:hypothetical protein
MDFKLWFACTILVACSEVLALDVTVQQFKESPGLYYDFIGEVQLYNTERKIVTYVNLESGRKFQDCEELRADVR